MQDARSRKQGTPTRRCFLLLGALMTDRSWLAGRPHRRRAPAAESPEAARRRPQSTKPRPSARSELRRRCAPHLILRALNRKPQRPWSRCLLVALVLGGGGRRLVVGVGFGRLWCRRGRRAARLSGRPGRARRPRRMAGQLGQMALDVAEGEPRAACSAAVNTSAAISSLASITRTAQTVNRRCPKV